LFFEYVRNLVLEVKAGGVKLYNKIITDIPAKAMAVSAAVATDAASTFVPSKTLDDTKLPGETAIGGVLLDTYDYVEIPTLEGFA
jgi:hypothetical protein